MESSPLQLLIFQFKHRWWSRVFILSLSFIAAVLGLLSPFFQKIFIDQITQDETSRLTGLFPESPLMMIGFAFACLLLGQGLGILCGYLATREALFLQKILGERLYRRTLSQKTEALTHRPVGETVSLYATDVPGATVLIEQSLPTGSFILFPILLAPFALVYLFDLPLLPVLSLMGFIIVLNSLMAYRQSKFFFRFKQLAAERTGLVNEWIQNIRTLRILGWVESFEDRIIRKRQEETKNRVSMVTNGQTMNAVASSVTFLINIVAILSLIHIQQIEVSPGTLLALLWILGVFLTRPFRQMPWFFTFVFDGYTSLKRLAHFFDESSSGHDLDEVFYRSPPEKKGFAGQALKIRSLNLQIGKEKLLQDIHLDIAPGEFIAIVGEVGSGKSLLLQSLMGETSAQFSEYQINGQNIAELSPNQIKPYFSFVPQDGFVMSATLRENVGFEYGIDRSQDEEIRNSLLRSQFDMSKERVSAGLETEIGERGVNLSGGQKQRVGIARADRFQAPILLLDDCLSAVDVDTEKKIVKELFFDRWNTRTRILCTHRLSVLEQVDRVYFLKEGRIQAHGSYAELLQSSQEFRDYTMTVARQKSAQSASSEANESNGKEKEFV